MTRPPEEDEELVPLPVDQRPPFPPDDGGPARPAPERPGLDRPWRTLGLGALLAVLVGAGALSGIAGEYGEKGPDRPAAPPPTGPGAPAERGSDEPAPKGWRRGAPGPLRHRDFAVRIWTGSELVVWGGDPDGDSGAAYDPAADRWRIIAPAPIPARCQGAAAWSGREVLIWGRACRLTPGPSPGRPRYETTAAAYDPVADSWRVLPTGPVVGGPTVLSVWTGTEWILANSVGPTGAFDPATDRWRALPPVPRPFTSVVAEWTGREVVALGVDILEKGPAVAGASFHHWAAVLDPATGRWRGLPEPPLRLAATAVWDGRRLVAWDQDLHAVSLDPAGDSNWKSLPDLPVDFTDCSPQGAPLGEVVFAEHCGHGALFHPSSGTWERIPHPRSLAEPPMWTGRDALFWVGSFAGSADGIWLYQLP